MFRRSKKKTLMKCFLVLFFSFFKAAWRISTLCHLWYCKQILKLGSVSAPFFLCVCPVDVVGFLQFYILFLSFCMAVWSQGWDVRAHFVLEGNANTQYPICLSRVNIAGSKKKKRVENDFLQWMCRLPDVPDSNRIYSHPGGPRASDLCRSDTESPSPATVTTTSKDRQWPLPSFVELRGYSSI